MSRTMGIIQEPEAIAVTWAALQNVASKEVVREAIPAGHERGVRIRIDSTSRALSGAASCWACCASASPA